MSHNDTSLIVPASILAPPATEWMRFTTGSPVIPGSLFSTLPKPTPEIVEGVLNTLVTRVSADKGWMILLHKNGSKFATIAEHVEWAVDALGAPEMPATNQWPVLTYFAKELHLPFFRGAWLKDTLIEMLRGRPAEVMGLSATLPGRGGGVVMVTAKQDSTGNLLPPAGWYGRKPGAKLNQITTPDDVSAALDAMEEEAEETRLITFEIIAGHRDRQSDSFQLKHPGARIHNVEGDRSTALFPSRFLGRSISELSE